MDPDAALRGNRKGIDAIDYIRMGQHALDGGIAHQLGLALRQPPAVGKMDTFKISGCQRGEKCTQTFCHEDVRGKLLILLVGHGGQVDRILHYPELEVVLNLLGNLHPYGLLRFTGRTGDMRSQDDVVQPEIRRIFQRLLAEDVEGSSGNLA